MADKPAKALLIFGDGLAGSLGMQHSNLHNLALLGSCGFLALRKNKSAEDEQQRIVTELAQLLDLHDVYSDWVKAEDVTSSGGTFPSDAAGIFSLSQRFMGVKGSFITNSKPAAALGGRAGFSVKTFDELRLGKDEACGLPNPSSVASTALNMLNLSAETTGADFELVFLHVHGTDEDTGSEDEVHSTAVGAVQGLGWVDRVVGELSHLSAPGTKAANHLYLVVVLGYGSKVNGSGEGVAPSLASLAAFPEELLKFRPKQSYKLKGGYLQEDVRDESPLLAVYHLNAVTRRDEATSFSFDEFSKRGGNLTILADRFLHEVAFKLWKAPKYGA